jgi:Ca2+-binding RTX toxin-like protein
VSVIVRARGTEGNGSAVLGCRLQLIALVALAVLVWQSGVAVASTVSVGTAPTVPGSDVVVYTADPGETNTITTTVFFTPSYVLEIKDAGATITVGPGCTSVAPDTARCPWDSELLEVDLGDGNDSLTVPRFVEVTTAALRGGNGNDTINGGGSSYSEVYLFGGLGTDLLRGREGIDYLDGGPGADILSGGSSVVCETAGVCFQETDTVTYAERTSDVHADADGVADDGEALEGDLIRRNVEHLVGGHGNDVLGGTAIKGGSIEGVPKLRGSILEGREGDDVLRGTRAGDYLLGDIGNDVLRGSRGRDTLVGNRGNDVLVAGRGKDMLMAGNGQDRLLVRDGHVDQVNGGRGNDEARVDFALDRVRRVETILP